VTNAGGSDEKTKTNYIAVSAALTPVAAFNSDVTSGTASLTVKFSDKSTNSPASWSWDFNNDGVAESTAQNPSFTYATAGVYTVKLTVNNSAGSSVKTKSNLITVREPWNVDVEGSGDYATIQEAVNAAAAGDTIIVKGGTYTENININKSLTLRSETPLGAIVNPASDESVSLLFLSNVVIDGFVISGSDTFPLFGITGGTYCTFTNNQISGVNTGIRVGNYSLVSNNTITTNGVGAIPGPTMYDMTAGILLLNGSSGNTITNNICTSTNGVSIGILILTVSGATVGDGYTPVFTEHNTISYNTFSSNRYGIYVQQSRYNAFLGNIRTDNQYGLYFQQNGDETTTSGNIFLPEFNNRQQYCPNWFLRFQRQCGQPLEFNGSHNLCL